MATDKKKRESDVEYMALRKEIYDQRVRIKMSVEYYGSMASWRAVWVFAFNLLTIVASCSAVVSFLSANKEYLGALIVATAVASIFSALNNWTDKKAKFLRAQELSRELEVSWDALWNKVDTYMYKSFFEVRSKYDALRERDADVTKAVDPHIERPWLLWRVQRQIEKSMGIRES